MREQLSIQRMQAQGIDDFFFDDSFSKIRLFALAN
jgi:hypothetical protein